MPTSAEQFSWNEGTLLVWTGAAAAYEIPYATEGRAQLVRGWANIGPMFDGSYVDTLTGQRADVTVAAAFTKLNTLQKIAESATAVHLEIKYSGVNGSAGYKFWSGRIPAVTVEGGDGGLIGASFSYYSNHWSAY